MISLNLMTPLDYLAQIAENTKNKRLVLNMSQQNLSLRSGVSLGSIKRFERTGQISLESLLKLALVLNSLDSFNSVFAPADLKTFPSLEAIIKQKSRKRGRK